MGPAATLISPRRRTADGLVPRPHLVDDLTGARDAAVVSVVAPGGYGKTTLLDAWEAAESRPFARVRLTALDDEPVRLLGRVLDAMEDVEPVEAPVRAAIEAPAPDIRGTVIPRLADMLSRRRIPLVVAIDDAHFVRSAAAISVLEALASPYRPGAALALFSRSPVPFPLGRLRVSRLLVELGPRDLAMDAREAGMLLAAAGAEVTADDARALWSRTEGWPAGLYLAALMLRTVPVAEVLVRLAGAEPAVADYLGEEFLAGLPDETVDFLTRSSILDELQGPLCDAVLARTGSAALLAGLTRGNLLFAPVGASASTYRCHCMLREVLRDRLRAQDPAAEPVLHRRAADWYRAHGDLERAGEHAVATRDPHVAGDLLWEHVPFFIAQGRNGTTQRWLASFPDHAIQNAPSLAMTAAHSCFALGDTGWAERWARVGLAALEGAEQPPRVSSLPAGALLIRAALTSRSVAEMEAGAQQAYDIEGDASFWRTEACMLLGVARQLAGDTDQARAWFEEGVHRAGAMVPIVETVTLAHLVLLALGDGDTDAAALHAERALRRVREARLGEYPTVALVMAAGALSRVRLERRDEAAALAREAERLLLRLVDFAPWYTAQTRVALAHVHLGLAEPEQARRLLADGSRDARRVAGADGLAACITATWSEVDDQADAALEGTAPLTMAELRILRFLPTHQSFREIGMRLHISTNTVKTHARAIYRKLGVTSRSEAVVRARQLGLLD